MNDSDILKRIDELLAIRLDDGHGSHGPTGQVLAGTTTLIGSLYGVDSELAKRVQDVASNLKQAGGMHSYGVGVILQGILKGIRGDVAGGLHHRLRSTIAGEVMGDMLTIARDASDKNVAAVLAAALFEDTIRRMGRELAGISERVDLQDVITGLKDKGVLKGPQIGIAQSFLKFRNDALHADWEKIDKSSTGSVLQFVQELLMKHFS